MHNNYLAPSWSHNKFINRDKQRKLDSFRSEITKRFPDHYLFGNISNLVEKERNMNDLEKGVNRDEVMLRLLYNGSDATNLFNDSFYSLGISDYKILEQRSRYQAKIITNLLRRNFICLSLNLKLLSLI